MPTPLVRLLPMSERHYPTYCAYFIEDYSQDLAGNHGLDLPSARHQAETSLLQYLPQGVATPGHRLLCILPDDERVATAAESEPLGYLWHAVDTSAQTSFIYDFYILPAHRGQGLGKAAMAALEAELKSLGVSQIKLRVAHDNPRALALYRAQGFATTATTWPRICFRLALATPWSPTDGRLG